jgi:hypothetical protein
VRAGLARSLSCTLDGPELGLMKNSRRDVLRELHDGHLTLDDVYAMSDSSEPVEMHANWGLSNVEWTAYAQGASWRDLVHWRYDGWPRLCTMCGTPLPAVEEFGWLVTTSEGASSGLRHVTCPQVDGSQPR